MASRGPRAWMAGKCLWKLGMNGRLRGMATLAYDEILVPERPSEGMRNVMFLHGLLGSGKNWRTFAKRLASSALEQSGPNSPGFRMILVDLRNHGNSASLQGFAPPNDIPAAARDVAELVKASSWNSPEMIISHSMGGKVALEFGQKSARGDYGDVAFPKQLWVLDSVPGKIPERSSEGEVEQVLSTIQSLPNPLPSRRWLVDHMTASGFSKSLADWLGSNLKRAKTSGEEMTWIFNPTGTHEIFFLMASWITGLCWNRPQREWRLGSCVLPRAIVGPLILSQNWKACHEEVEREADMFRTTFWKMLDIGYM